MTNPRTTIAVIITLAGLPCCSLLIDTNPDGIINPAGAAGMIDTRVSNGLAGAGGNANRNNSASMTYPAVAGGGQTAMGGATLGVGGALSGGGASVPGGSPGIAGSTSSSVVTGGMAGVAGAFSALGGMSGAAATGGTAGAPSDCPGTGGPTMVKLPQGFCIDSTEVTRAQYTAWLNTIRAETLSGQDQARCGWNTSFAPSGSCMQRSQVCQGPACGNHPQVCVDWCDAMAYCKGVGKRLCGRIGGGTSPVNDYGNEAISQWQSACSNVGTTAFPYAYGYVPKACNGADLWENGTTPTTVEVGTLPGCQPAPPYDGVHDLSGNVREWEDSCDTGDTVEWSLCLARGGYYDFGARALSCRFDSNSMARADVNEYTGLRCCGP